MADPAKKDEKKKTKKAKDPNAKKGFGSTLRDGAGNTMRIQTKYRGNELHSSITRTTKDAEGKKVRAIGARAVHGDEASAKTWQENAVAKLKSKGYTEKGKRGSKTDAFDLDSIPDAQPAPAVA